MIAMTVFEVSTIIALIIIAIILVIVGYRAITRYIQLPKKDTKQEFEIEYPFANFTEVGKEVNVTIDGIQQKAIIVKKYKENNRIRVRKL